MASTAPPTLSVARPPAARVSIGRLVRRDAVGLAAIIVLILIVTVSLLAPLIAPYDHSAQSLLDRLQPPSREHLAGTDGLGRDVLSRLIWGGRISLAVGVAATVLTLAIGVLVGSVSGYFGGAVDQVAMRLTDVFMAIPPVLLILLVVAVFGGGLGLTIIAIGVVSWPGTARLLRGEILRLRHQEFVEAARVTGLGPRRIITRHVLPNALAPMIVQASLLTAEAILIESGLSYLGLGVQPPTPSWGNMLFEGRRFFDVAWWISTWPGVAIFATVICLNLAGDLLRDVLDPRMRQQMS